MMRTPRLLSLAAVATVMAAVVALGAPFASAERKDTLVVTPENTPFTVVYDEGIESAAPYPTSEDTDPTVDRLRDPDACGSANYCDTIPVTIKTPDVGVADDVRIVFTLELLDPSEDCCVDLDLYFWDNKQRKEDPAADESPYLLIQKSATNGSHERIEFSNPDLDEYNFTVVAWLGPTSGYKMSVEMFTDEFVAPFELLEPEPTPGGPTEPFGPPPTEAPLPAPPQGDARPPTLGGIDAELDEDLEIDVPSIEDQLAAGQFDFEPASEQDDFGPVSTGALVATLLVLPAIAVAGGGAWMFRRHRMGAI